MNKHSCAAKCRQPKQHHAQSKIAIKRILKHDKVIYLGTLVLSNLLQWQNQFENLKNIAANMKFSQVKDLSSLLPVLEKRLPNSTNVLNAAKSFSKWILERRWYIVGEDVDTAVIVCITQRPDHMNKEIIVSRDANTPLSPAIYDAFLTTDAFSWDESYCFAAVDGEISDMVLNISLRKFGNSVAIHPCFYYTLTIEQGKSMDTVFNSNEGVHVGPLHGDIGAEFIANTWKYSSPGTKEHCRKILERNLSSGVYVNGTIVTGATFNTQGLIGMLYTLEENRGHGFGEAAMHFLMRKCAENGFFPACTVEIKNHVCNAFQKKIGFTNPA